jgi:RimJ/RimL family protein N-acetyltransferase
LRLDRLVEADAPAMHKYRSDPEVCRYQSFEPGPLADIEAFIGRLQGDQFNVPGTWFQLAIRLEESGQLIGDLGIYFSADDPQQAKIGFTLSPDYQGRGYATEAVIGVLDHLFGSLQKHRVIASVDPRNGPSIALLKRVGMGQEAHFRQSLWFKGEWVDDIVFGIVAEEWNGRKRRTI